MVEGPGVSGVSPLRRAARISDALRAHEHMAHASAETPWNRWVPRVRQVSSFRGRDHHSLPSSSCLGALRARIPAAQTPTRQWSSFPVAKVVIAKNWQALTTRVPLIPSR
jgi:hypothetical protein